MNYKTKSVIKSSYLGLETVDVPSFMEGFIILKSETAAVNTYWNPLMGEQKSIQNNYNELLLTLEQKSQESRILKVRFRVFNDGLGFRHEFPKQGHLKYFIIKEERSEFNLAADAKTSPGSNLLNT